MKHSWTISTNSGRTCIVYSVTRQKRSSNVGSSIKKSEALVANLNLSKLHLLYAKRINLFLRTNN